MGASTLAHSAHPETPQPLHQPLLAHELTGFLGLSLTREMSLQLKIAQQSPAKLPAPTAMQRMGRFYERFVHPQTYCLGWDFGPCSAAGSMQVCKWGHGGDTRFPAHPPCLDGRHLHGMPRELPQMWGLVGPGGHIVPVCPISALLCSAHNEGECQGTHGDRDLQCTRRCDRGVGGTKD